MTRRRRRRRNTPEEQQRAGRPPERETLRNGRQGEQWQQSLGNAYLQRRVQGREDGDPADVAQKRDAEPPCSFSFKGRLPARIDRDKLLIDMKKITDLHSLGVNRATLPGKIQGWLVALSVALGHDEEPHQNLGNIDRDGLLELPLGKQLIGRMTALMGEDPDKIQQINPQLPFGAAGLSAKAELHFNSDGLEDLLPVEIGAELLGQAEREPGLYVIVRLSASFPGPGLSDEQDELDGTLILKADF